MISHLPSTYPRPSEELKVRMPFRGIYWGKRLFDILTSIFVSIFFLSWFLPIVGLLICIDSKGPVFFIQLRTGRNGRQFRCLKLRTMAHRPDSTFQQATKNDPRVTRLGAFLRKTNLDEMPQFLNVLVGDMSVVGPRPHAIQHDAQFFHSIPNYRNRYAIKPGITGLAQTRGLRGETNLKEMQNRVKMDIWYIKNHGPILDIKICWWTIQKMFKGDEKAV
ncbi:sugar transferase [Tellurirhabdus rosea]|uniref:sugar transferase n=1 Tax=Tellurirhabdus rosea TaxID=2674997 RepID=UPI0022587698|nr:sugar transferase [Tellurirhabdus rosea]